MLYNVFIRLQENAVYSRRLYLYPNAMLSLDFNIVQSEYCTHPVLVNFLLARNRYGRIKKIPLGMGAGVVPIMFYSFF